MTKVNVNVITLTSYTVNTTGMHYQLFHVAIIKSPYLDPGEVEVVIG